MYGRIYCALTATAYVVREWNSYESALKLYRNAILWHFYL
jgi:hypothetical protein